MLAFNDLERLGVNPIEMLVEVYKLSIQGYKEGRGITDKADSGSSWLAVARQAADNLASYKYPKLSAMAVKDVTEEGEGRSAMTTEEAVRIIKSDPFAIADDEVTEAMSSAIAVPKLPESKS